MTRLSGAIADVFGRHKGPPPVSVRLQRLCGGRWNGGRYALWQLDGYWADTILAECHFLEQRGYRPTRLSFHFRGDGFEYEGPKGSITFSSSDDFEAIYTYVSLEGCVADLATLGARWLPDTPVPPQQAPLDRPTVLAVVRYQAAVLRAAAEAIL